MNLELDQPVEAVQRTPSAAAAKLSVLHVGKFYPPHMGGIETHLQALCGALRNHADVRVIVSSEDRNTVEEMVDSVPSHVCPRSSPPSRRPSRPAWFPASGIRAPAWFTSICPIPP